MVIILRKWCKVKMKIYQRWKRNEPDSVVGESITVTITYCSFKREEIDELQKKMPNGMLVMDTDKKETETRVNDATAMRSRGEM